jgi:hypothetical protein
VDVVVRMERETEAATGTISGKLIDTTTRKPVEGVKVLTTSAASGPETPILSANTGSDGGFQFNAVPPGSYNVWVLESENPVEPEEGVEVKAGETATVVLCALKGTPVEGKVFPAVGGAPLAGVAVFAPGSKTVLTDKNGKFSIRVLPGPGIISAVGNKRGYGRIEHKFYIPQTGKVTGLILKLPRATRVVGRVTDSSGRPADGALVSLMTQNGPDDMAQTDSKGYYEIHLDPTSIKVGSKYMLAALDPATGAVAMISVKPVGAKDVRADIGLLPPASLTGTVKDTSGKPVPNVRLIPLFYFGGYRIYSLHNEAKADASGNFTIRSLIPGARYAIRVDAEGYAPSVTAAENLPVLNSGKTARLDVVLSPLKEPSP